MKWKWTPTIGAILMAVVTALTPAVQEWVMAHPAWATVFAAVGTILSNFVTPPHK